MESIKTRITNVPQRTGYKSVSYDVDGIGATAVTFNAANSDTMKITVPAGAIVTDTPIFIHTAWANSGNNYVTTGYPAKSLNADTGASLASAAAVADAFLDGNNSAKVRGHISTTGHGAAIQTGTVAAAGLATSAMWEKCPYVLADDGSKEYAVHLTMAVAGGTSGAGKLFWWVEYIFPPNIVWAQADLA